MREAEDVEQLVGAADVVDAAPALGHGRQHQHVRPRALEVACNIITCYLYIYQ